MVNTQTTELELLGPRFICLRLHGTFTEDEATAVWNTIEEHVRDEPYFLIETHMSDVDGASPEARRISAEKLRRLPRRAIAIVGGGFAQKIIAKLVLTAVSMLDGSSLNTARFFPDSDSAREWLKSYAAERDAEAASKQK